MSVKNNKKFFFIGGDFIDSQYLWIMPFINGYCQQNKIENLLFEKPLANHLRLNKNLSPIFNKYHIRVFKKNIFFYFYSVILLFLNFFLYLELLFLDNSFFKKKKSSLNFQIKHSFWDTYIRTQKNYFKFNFYTKLKSIASVHSGYTKAFSLNTIQVDTALLGHTVYSRRTILAYLKDKGVKVITQANFSFQFHSHFNETRWDLLPREQIKQFLKCVPDDIINNYWNDRLQGRGNYEDANIAANIKLENNILSKQNFLMLHIFRDSPFNFLDKERIFSDYYDWIFNTLKILIKSKEDWWIRVHPNSDRWGENSLLVLNEIISKSILNLPKNIKIDNKNIPSQELYSKAKRIVTFSGTSNLEIACCGIKPIIISETILSYYNKSYVSKPSNIKEYEELLLSDYENQKFKLNESDILNAKKLIYLRENIFSFRNDLNAIYIYRDDEQKLYDRDFEQTNNSYSNFSSFLFSMGYRFNSKITHTVSKKFEKYLY